jgi:hypothetical protein
VSRARKEIVFATHEALAEQEAQRWRSASVGVRLAALEAIRQAWFKLQGSVPERMERTHRLVALAPRALSAGRRTRTRGLGST